MNKPTLSGRLGLFLLGFAVAPLCYWWQGYLGTFVWGWFAVSTFGARPIATWQAAGVIALLHFFLPTQIRETSDKERDWPIVVSEALVYGFLIPLIAFGSSAFASRTSAARRDARRRTTGIKGPDSGCISLCRHAHRLQEGQTERFGKRFGVDCRAIAERQFEQYLADCERRGVEP